MSNLIDSLKKDTAAEIARVESYLKVLKNLQSAVASPGKKRKYTKRKPVAKKKPIRPKKNAILTEAIGNVLVSKGWTGNYPAETNIMTLVEPKLAEESKRYAGKKKPGRSRKKAA